MSGGAAHLVLDEVFLSLQGEAGEVGRPSLFVRLGGCPIRCDYCDTPRSWTDRPRWELHGRHRTESFANPVASAELTRRLASLCEDYAVVLQDIPLAVTGGEPLIQADALAEWLPTLSCEGVLLETAGTDPTALADLLPFVDRVSLDWKLPHTLRSGSTDPVACLDALAAGGASGWVKLVVTADTTREQVDEAFAAIAEAGSGLAVWLQPVTEVVHGPAAPSSASLLDWCLAARTHRVEARVLPQVHPLLGVR